MRVVLGSTLASAALMAVDLVMRHTFDGTGFILLCSCLRFRVCENFLCMNKDN